jgi:hypothetical protein
MGFHSISHGITKLLLLPLAALTLVLAASPASAAPTSAQPGWSTIAWTGSVAATADAPMQINDSPSCDIVPGPFPRYYVDFFCSIPPLMVVHLHVICSSGIQSDSPAISGPRMIRARAVCGPPFTVNFAWWD